MPHRLRFVAAVAGGPPAAAPARGLPVALSGRPILGWALKLLLALAAVWLVSAGEARAQACTPTIANTNFGSPNLVAGTGLTTTATISFSCTGLGGGGTYYVCPSFGQGSGGVSGTSRTMAGGAGATLRYNLYSDAGRTTRWGSLTDASLGAVPRIAVTRSGGTGTASATIYGGIDTGQASAQPGSYSSSFTGQVSVKLIQGGAQNCATNAALSTNTSGSFTVLASPVAACTLTAGALSFGSDGVLDADRDATSSLSVTCASGLAYSVQLDNGVTGTGPTARQMTSGGQDITYGLYRDVARSLPWGGVGQATSATGTGAAQAYTVYGRVPPQTTPTPGTYSDTVVASIVY